MNKHKSPPKYVKAKTTASFALIFLRTKLLVGFDKDGRVAVPGGKMEDEDNYNPDATLAREISQEVGGNLKLRQISQPMIFGSCPNRKTPINPTIPGVSVDLRWFYVLEVVAGEPEESEPDEFRNPHFVDIRSLADKVDGKQIRSALAYALRDKHFQGRGLLPPPHKQMRTVATDWRAAAERLRQHRFSPERISKLTTHHAPPITRMSAAEAEKTLQGTIKYP